MVKKKKPKEIMADAIKGSKYVNLIDCFPSGAELKINGSVVGKVSGATLTLDSPNIVDCEAVSVSCETRGIINKRMAIFPRYIKSDIAGVQFEGVDVDLLTGEIKITNPKKISEAAKNFWSFVESVIKSSGQY